MPRKARRRSTCRASSESWRASGNGIGMIGLRLGIARFRCPKSGLSRFHAGVIRLLELRPLSGEKAKPFKMFDKWLQTPGPWVAGIDFPFSQPRQLVLDLVWRTVG